MVDGGSPPGTQAALRSLLARPAVSFTRVAHTVCGLCLLEAEPAAGNGVGRPGSLLEERIVWEFIHAGIAHRQAAPCNAKLPWRDADLSVVWKTAGAVENPGPDAAGHLVHGPGGRLHGLASPLHGPG